jgi:hypothetical protein
MVVRTNVGNVTPQQKFESNGVFDQLIFLIYFHFILFKENLRT